MKIYNGHEAWLLRERPNDLLCDRRYPLLYVVCYSAFQIETMLLLTGSTGQSLVEQAAKCWDKAMFEAVFTAIREKLQPEQVIYRLFSAR